MKDELLDEIIKAILSMTIHQEEYADATYGIDGDFLSEHSRNIVTLEGFDYTLEWINQHPQLKQFLDIEFYDWLEDQADEYVFEGWLTGGRVYLSADGYISTVIRDLELRYREGIEDEWTCEKCGEAISEKYEWKHPKSIHRIGTAYGDGYKYHLYCRDCWEKKVSGE